MIRQQCNYCHGDGYIREVLRDLAGKSGHGCGIDSILLCPQCNGKKYCEYESLEHAPCNNPNSIRNINHEH